MSQRFWRHGEGGRTRREAAGEAGLPWKPGGHCAAAGQKPRTRTRVLCAGLAACRVLMHRGPSAQAGKQAAGKEAALAFIIVPLAAAPAAAAAVTAWRTCACVGRGGNAAKLGEQVYNRASERDTPVGCRPWCWNGRHRRRQRQQPRPPTQALDALPGGGVAPGSPSSPLLQLAARWASAG